jgi:hypothetical protein
VHKLNCNQLGTTNELLDIATRHASGEEAAKAIFVLGDGKMVPSTNWGPPSKATEKGAKKGTKCSKKGKNGTLDRS